MTKHTPGPWEWTDHAGYELPVDSTLDVAVLQQENGNPSKAVLEYVEFGLADNLAANAKLIAAAPDLLEALQAMILMTRRGSVVYLLSTEQEAVLAEAEAVVARVEGEVE